MKYLAFPILFLLGTMILISSCKDDNESCVETTWYQDADNDGLGNPDISQTSCEQPAGYVANNSDSDDSNFIGTPLSAFDEFNPDAVTFSFDGNEVTIESTGVPNHTSPYWQESHPLHIEQTFGDHTTPGFINERSYTVTLPLNPQIASTSSATGLGAIGIAVTGAPIFNDEEGPNVALDLQTAGGLDYAGGHNGPSGYHYHLEAADVPENTTLSYDDEQLIGIMADGFLLYGRTEMDGSYPTDLDASGGHYGVTPHSDGEEIYHYHIINEYYISSLIMLFGGDLQGTPNTIF